VRARLTSTVVLGAVTAMLVASASAAASPVDLPPPTVETILGGGLTPTKLPVRERIPVSLRLAETVRTPDGSHPPALQGLRVDLDRQLGLSVKGLPSCPRYLGGRQSREKPFERCEDAKVGSGTVELEVAFPEQTPVDISGELSVYNGGFRDGRTMFWLFVYFPAPVTGGILMPLDIRRDGHGRYGWLGQLEIPKIANGAGSITYLGVRFRRRIFSASCAGGRLLTGARSRFADGSVVSSTLTRTCKT
jgi:hypothetical protein